MRTGQYVEDSIAILGWNQLKEPEAVYKAIEISGGVTAISAGRATLAMISESLQPRTQTVGS